MYRHDPYVVLTREAAHKIATASSPGAELTLRHAPSEEMYVVDTVETVKGVRARVDISRAYEALKWGDRTHQGQWMRQPEPNLHAFHLTMLRRPGTSVPFERFREMVPGVDDPGTSLGLLISHDPDLAPEIREQGGCEFAGWLIQRSGVRPLHLEVEPDTIGLEQLAGKWPIEELAGRSVMVVGVGSIGGAAAESLAGYGIGRLELVDHDRFLWHNMVRHVLGAESVGRFKVDAMRTHLQARWPHLDAKAHRLNVVEDADDMRSLVPTVDLVLCTADGIAPRRVVSHLARQAKTPAVLACVLDQGAVGEVLRLRPTPRFGCLLCQRADLTASGAMDAEADQELAYGTGQIHQPMTAVAPDLHLIGQLAAKSAVATILESLHGDHTQRLPGEHALIGLRPAGDLAPPYDLARAGEVRWASIPKPRAICYTCGSSQ
ncbi:HesA/MoeB/ThiF family protein [Rhodococcus sp. NPDC059968]|uniref:HesA/MoeB/ThiF family protein n=1 Tax=Rhodococcus sp. NPDC059968 TaxID=3347017 RepID=UPI00367305C4